jgi:hypothetical protein
VDEVKMVVWNFYCPAIAEVNAKVDDDHLNWPTLISPQKQHTHNQSQNVESS